MSKMQLANSDSDALIDSLASTDGTIRQTARESLVTRGKRATASLINVLGTSTSHQVRWEAAKALGEIADFRSIPALVKALEDSDPDVAWLAAEALRLFKRRAWAPLLRALMKGGENPGVLRLGAHHVFAHQKEEGFDDVLANLMKSLDHGAAPDSAIVAAYEVLQRMKATV